jgi:hypothetical protein
MLGAALSSIAAAGHLLLHHWTGLRRGRDFVTPALSIGGHPTVPALCVFFCSSGRKV